MKRCALVGGKFGLLRYGRHPRQCSGRCREKFLNQSAKDRDKIHRWLGFLRPVLWELTSRSPKSDVGLIAGHFLCRILGPVDIHRSQMMAPTKNSMAANDIAVFS
jgi:hypothetical protein